MCGGRLEHFAAQPVSVYASDTAYHIRRCAACRCGITDPVPTEEQIARMYERDYDYSAHTLIAAEKRWRSRRLLSRLRVAPGSALLDVGCMYGYLLDEARAIGVGRLEGVELSGAAVRDARTRGLAVFHGTLEEYAKTGPAPFDVIVAQHVLEHIRDADGFLRAAVELLAPDGRLVLCVPHFGARSQRWFTRSWGWYQLPVHLRHYSPAALSVLVGRYGAEVEELTLRGGDSLFVLLTILYALSAPPARGAPMSRLKRALVALASLLLRPYYFLGDEEMIVVLRRRRGASANAGDSR